MTRVCESGLMTFSLPVGVPVKGGVPSVGVQPDHHAGGAGQRVCVLGRGEVKN